MTILTDTTLVDQLLTTLEPMIRRVVREELQALAKQEPDIFYLDPDTPLYADMQDILQRKAEGRINLISHAEVWDA